MGGRRGSGGEPGQRSRWRIRFLDHPNREAKHREFGHSLERKLVADNPAVQWFAYLMLRMWCLAVLASPQLSVTRQ